MFCSNCGIKIDDNAKFCYNCGAENLKANRIGNIEDANKNLEVFVICNENVKIEKGLITYGRLEKKALQKAGEILDQSREDYLNKVDKIKNWQDKCDLLTTIGNHACNQMIEYCAGFLIELGIYTYPKSLSAIYLYI